MGVLLDSKDAGSGMKTSTEIVELVDDKVNKYKPVIQAFRFLTMTGLQESTRKIETNTIDISKFLMNKDLTPFQSTKIEVNRSSCIMLKLPKEITRSYPNAKYIPCSTRFVVSFENGDMTKAKIISGLFEDNIMNV